MASFRTRSGKGAKPAKIPAGQFAEVCELLTGTLSAVQAAGQSLAPADEPELDDYADDYEDGDDE